MKAFEFMDPYPPVHDKDSEEEAERMRMIMDACDSRDSGSDIDDDADNIANAMVGG